MLEGLPYAQPTVTHIPANPVQALRSHMVGGAASVEARVAAGSVSA